MVIRQDTDNIGILNILMSTQIYPPVPECRAGPFGLPQTLRIGHSNREAHEADRVTYSGALGHAPGAARKG